MLLRQLQEGLPADGALTLHRKLVERGPRMLLAQRQHLHAAGGGSGYEDVCRRGEGAQAEAVHAARTMATPVLGVKRRGGKMCGERKAWAEAMHAARTESTPVCRAAAAAAGSWGGRCE
eukprot:229541-Chlamydomonas_euryale.AAC.1